MSKAALASDATLLVVDDDTSTRKLLKGVLGRLGYQIVEAKNGQEAIEHFASAHPALVLLDVMMPVVDGFQACEQIRALDGDQGTPIIMLTGADDHSAIDRAFDAGATDFITKPINWSLLTQRVRYALRSSLLYHELLQNRTRQAAARRIAKLLFWEWNLLDNQLYWSDDIQPLLGIPQEALSDAERFFALIHPEDQPRTLREMNMVRSGGGSMEIELRLQYQGLQRVVRMFGERSTNTRNQEQSLFGALQDVTDAHQREQTIKRMEYYDELTNLGNRRLFLMEIAAAQHDQQISRDDALLIAWIDLVRFHRHNDVLGETRADALLRRFAQRLVRLAGENAGVYRVGGDEFGVLLHSRPADDALAFFEQMLERLGQPFWIGDEEAFLVCSVGVAVQEDHRADANQLLTLAQDAQRAARQQSRSMVVARTETRSQAKTQELLSLERYLYKALENNEFFLYYQPQMNLRWGKIVGVEALLRWRHPQRGMISPAEFVPLLEDTGLINRVGQWVLEEGCRQAAVWQRDGLDLRVGINLSPRQFLEPGLETCIRDAIVNAGVSADAIELEITETLAMQDPTHAITLLRNLQSAGIQIAIDDFGIGHSSLEYLLQFPINAIKIDRAFVKNITQVIADRAIVRAVAAIGNTLGLTIVAEGIETIRQCDFLEALGATEIQGYLIGKPMEAEKIEEMVRNFVRPGLDE